MWDVIGGYADNDPEVVLMHAEELEKITDRILDGCKDSFIRADAYVMKGKILHAQGQTEDAAMLYREQLPDWYQTAGQKTEQLFAKDSPEFADALRKNTDELVRFALNKLLLKKRYGRPCGYAASLRSFTRFWIRNVWICGSTAWCRTPGRRSRHLAEQRKDSLT